MVGVRRSPFVTGLVLAGGSSRRMGQNKPLLVLGGETLIARQLRLLRGVCRSVAVLGPTEWFTGLDVAVLPDELPGRGPLGGLYTGLKRTRTEFNLLLGCDLPFVDPRFLDFLCRRALALRADVTVPESHDRGAQPLCGLYRRRAWKAVRATLEAGVNKFTAFFPRVLVDRVPWREIARAGFSSRMFDNMNTREDYEAAKKRLSVSL